MFNKINHDLHANNYKMMIKIKDLIKTVFMNCKSCNIKNMSIFPKLIYSLNVIPVKIISRFITDCMSFL